LLVLTRQPSEQLAGVAVADLGFTRREREVAAWICQGKTNMEVATILGVSPRTIHKHVEHLFEKTGTESRLALTVLLNEPTIRRSPSVAPPL
jgi:DNA-binding CsgD family transcriptional regulator